MRISVMVDGDRSARRPDVSLRFRRTDHVRFRSRFATRLPTRSKNGEHSMRGGDKRLSVAFLLRLRALPLVYIRHPTPGTRWLLPHPSIDWTHGLSEPCDVTAGLVPSSKKRPQLDKKSIVVAIPVKNEADRIGPCLRSLGRQTVMPCAVLLLLNNCTDETDAAARALAVTLPYALHIKCHTFPSPVANAGHARRMVMQYAAELAGFGGILLTTDADAVVAHDWIERNLLALSARADLVCGRAVVDPAEAALIPSHLHAAVLPAFRRNGSTSNVDFPLLQRLALPITVGAVRYPGIKIHDPSVIRLLEVLLHGGSHVGGWTTRQIHQAVLATFHVSDKAYGLNQLRYDLRKLKGHGLLQRDGSRYAYRLTPKGVQVALLVLFFHKRLCGPLAHSESGVGDHPRRPGGRSVMTVPTANNGRLTCL
jgi:glycosyltransferase involved in cell wall biosynthesis